MTAGHDTLAAQSRRALTEALLALMEQDDFHQVTVLQLCQEAGLSRRTFYRHFRTKEEVLQRHLEELRQDFITSNGIDGEVGTGEAIELCFAYFDKQRRLLTLLDRHRLFYLVKEMLEDYMRGACTEEYAGLLHQPGMEAYFDSYFASSLSAVLELWVREGFVKSPGELARFTRQLHILGEQ